MNDDGDTGDEISVECFASRLELMGTKMLIVGELETNYFLQTEPENRLPTCRCSIVRRTFE